MIIQFKLTLILHDYYQQNENDQQIQRLREELENHKKMLAKQKQQYAEFSSITNDMERELHESQAKGRELNKILQSKTKEHKQMLQEKVFIHTHFARVAH
jgi:uncharacterized protein YdaU (DUF1376 family)